MVGKEPDLHDTEKYLKSAIKHEDALIIRAPDIRDKIRPCLESDSVYMYTGHGDGFNLIKDHFHNEKSIDCKSDVHLYGC